MSIGLPLPPIEPSKKEIGRSSRKRRVQGRKLNESRAHNYEHFARTAGRTEKTSFLGGTARERVGKIKLRKSRRRGIIIIVVSGRGEAKVRETNMRRNAWPREAAKG